MSSPEARVNPLRTSSQENRNSLDRRPPDSVKVLPAPSASDAQTADESSHEFQGSGGQGYNQGVEGNHNERSEVRQATESVSSSESTVTPGVRTKGPLKMAPEPQDPPVGTSYKHSCLEPTEKPQRQISSDAPSSLNMSSDEKHNNESSKSSIASMNPDPNLEKVENFPTATDEGSGSEIQSIMDQFDNKPPDEDDESDSSRVDFPSTLLGRSVQHPPRKSSLEPIIPSGLHSLDVSQNRVALAPSYPNALSEIQEKQNVKSSTPVEPMRRSSLPQPILIGGSAPNTPSSPNSSLSTRKPLPPEPDPEPDLPFDFHRFLEQLRHRTADPVAKFLRSFLIEFGKKQWMVHEQVKLIRDFLAFIANKMSQCEVWRGVSDAEFDNAKEGMEKLVMNRLYSQTFSPAIPSPVQAPGVKGKRKNLEKFLGPGRRGQHQEDIERDEILGQKVRIYGWVQEEHLDIPPVGDSGKRFLALAQQELLKIKTYRAPRDKVICVLNCCKVIFGLLRNSKKADTSADSFVPLLIYIVLHANPEHLVSNIQYILRFRNQDKLGGEAGYYLSSLMGAIQFIENLDRTSLTVSDADFERNVEAAVFVIAERHKEEIPQSIRHPVSEKSRLSEPEMVPRNSVEAEYVNPVRPGSSRDGNSTGDGSDESTAVNGLLRTIQKPLSSIGRIFSEDTSKVQHTGNRSLPEPTSQPTPPPRLSPAVFQPPRHSNDTSRPSEGFRERENPGHSQENRLAAEDHAARQASAEAAEAQRIQRAEHDDVVETLAGIFPDLDRDVIDDVVRMKQGRIGLAVDACLALAS